MKKQPEIIIENVPVSEEDEKLLKENLISVFKSFDWEELSRKAS